MREYLSLINGGQTAQDNMPQSKKQEYYVKWAKFLDYLKDRKVLVNGNPLLREGKVISGAFENQIDWNFEPDVSTGGYFVILATNLEEAVGHFKTCPIYETGGTVVVRPSEKM